MLVIAFSIEWVSESKKTIKKFWDYDDDCNKKIKIIWNFNFVAWRFIYFKYFMYLKYHKDKQEPLNQLQVSSFQSR